MKRREFLGAMGAAALGAGTFSLSEELYAKIESGRQLPLPRRPYGKSGDMLSVIGFPAIMMRKYEQHECNQKVRAAYERGVNYYDVAPSYGDSEERLGPALEPFRKDVFLACKSKARK